MAKKYPRSSNGIARSQKAGSTTVLAAIAVVVSVTVIIGMSLDQIESAFVLGVVSIGLAILRPQTGIIVSFVYLAFMGELRKYLWVEAGSVQIDPLLLIGPAMAVWLCASALIGRHLRLNTAVSKAILLFLVIMTLQIFNPLQGDLLVGFAGALIYIVPLLWFWVGKAYGSAEFTEKVFYRVVVPISVVAGLLGLVQTEFGFFAFEARYIRIAHLTMVMVSKAPRPFSLFPSPQEYSAYVMIALIVVVIPLVLKRTRISLVVAPLLAACVVLCGSRGPIVAILLSISAVWAVQARQPAVIAGRGFIVLCIGLAGIVYLATQAQDMRISDEIDPYIARQADGFLKPAESTAGTHGAEIVEGIKNGIVNPIGYGLGATTSASKLKDIGGTEFDLSNMFVSLGVVGGLCYVFVMVAICRQSFLDWQRMRSLTSLLFIGLLASSVGNWINGALYSTSALLWFAIGSMDREFSQGIPPAVLPAATARPASPAPRRRVLRLRGQHA